jgi:hypothetical protein
MMHNTMSVEISTHNHLVSSYSWLFAFGGNMLIDPDTCAIC